MELELSKQMEYNKNGNLIPNRAYDTRRDDDLLEIPSVTIYDIDYAMLYHLTNNIKPTVEENGKTVPVPVVYASGESWNQIQRHGYLRDAQRKSMAPIIALRRNSISYDDRFTNLHTPYKSNSSSGVISFPVQQFNNQNDWINKTNNTKKSETYMVTRIVDYVKVNYQIYIWANLNIQLNTIVEQLLTQNRLPWGDMFKFVTTLQSADFELDNSPDMDRLVSCTLTMDVDGRIQPEYVLDQSTIRKAHSIKRVSFRNELEQYELYPDHKPKIIQSSNTSRLSKKSI